MMDKQLEMPKNMTTDMAVAEMADCIVEAIVDSRDALIAVRDGQIAAEIAPLDSETESLLKEHAAIAAARVSLESLLPATARLAQHEADVLLLAGNAEGAEAKFAEAKQAETAPKAMAERQQEINIRIAAIDSERKVILRRVFEDWQGKLQPIIRAAERGLFIELLDRSRDAMYGYQERHDLQGTIEHPYDFLVKAYHLSSLTAHERSLAWRSGNRWYGTRA